MLIRVEHELQTPQHVAPTLPGSRSETLAAPEHLLQQLQRSAGNKAVLGFMAQRSRRRVAVQRFDIPPANLPNTFGRTRISITPNAVARFSDGTRISLQFVANGGRGATLPLRAGQTGVVEVTIRTRIVEAHVALNEAREQDVSFAVQFSATQDESVALVGPLRPQVSPPTDSEEPTISLNAVSPTIAGTVITAPLTFTTGGSTRAIPVIGGSTVNNAPISISDYVEIIAQNTTASPPTQPAPSQQFVTTPLFPLFFTNERDINLRPGEVDALRVWWSSIPAFVRRSIAGHHSELYIDGYASRTGEGGVNDNFARDRAFNVRTHLRRWAPEGNFVVEGHSAVEASQSGPLWYDRRATVWTYVPSGWRPVIERNIRP